MRWDSSRPVPWERLMREWVLYVGIMAVILYIFFRDQGFVGAAAGLLISGPLYLAIGYVLAKLGYTRKTLKEMRTPRAEPTAAEGSDETRSGGSVERPKPPPTRRTSTGVNRPKRKRR
jgi:hypothetical protein